MWSEHLRPVLLDYAVWPRAAAAAERLWSRAEDTQVQRGGGVAGGVAMVGVGQCIVRQLGELMHAG